MSDHDGTTFKSSTLRISETIVISRRKAVLALSAVGIFAAAPAWAQSKSNALAKLDTDNDGTVDLAEAKRAASAVFDRLDRDHDGTLDRAELQGRLNSKEFAAADPAKGGTLTKDEYLAVVERRFRAANPDNDGTLDAKELRSKAGQALLRLLQ
jgi:Ca2+-binding EF-hand superfamily protein